MTSSKRKIRVMLADDHAIVRAGIRQFLNQARDIEVVAEAEDGETAKTLIQEHAPDVAVLDMQMPRATGIEVTRWVKKNIPHVGVLILTAYDDVPYVAAVLQAGANGYMLKTATPDEIVQAVREVDEGKSALDAAIARKVTLHVFKKEERLPGMLTDRETEVLALAARGFTNKAIGVQLSISDRTVQGHLAHIFTKLQANSRTEAVMRAVSLGLIAQDVGAFKED